MGRRVTFFGIKDKIFDSSTFVYTRLVTCLHSSTVVFTHLSSNSSTFAYTRLVTRLHSSVTRLHSSNDSFVFLEQIHLELKLAKSTQIYGFSNNYPYPVNQNPSFIWLLVISNPSTLLGSQSFVWLSRVIRNHSRSPQY